MTQPITFLSSIILITSGGSTIYEGIHYELFSNILLLSTIKVYKLISSVPKPSLQSFLNVTDQVSHPQL